MGKMTIRRMEGGGFELSGGPIIFKDYKDIEDTMVQLLRFPLLKMRQGDVETPVPSMEIDDEREQQ